MHSQETPTFNRRFTLLTLLYCAFLFFLSSQSTLPVPDIFSWQDLVLHAGAYTILGLLARKAAPHASWVLILLFVMLYGASDEIHQLFVPGRCCDILDFAADTVGGTIALIINRYFL